MNNYDTMSVDALLAEYVHAQWVGFYTGVESEISIKSALRKAVIREASVGTVKLSHNGVASDYDIIPKETP